MSTTKHYGKTVMCDKCGETQITVVSVSNLHGVACFTCNHCGKQQDPY